MSVVAIFLACLADKHAGSPTSSPRATLSWVPPSTASGEPPPPGRSTTPPAGKLLHAAASQAAPRIKMSSSQSRRQARGTNVPAPIQHEDEDDRLAKLRKWIHEIHQQLMLAAAIWACAAYRTALHPPGGYWKHDKEGPDGHAAGTPVMASYETFRMLNTMTFVYSLVLVLLLSSERFYRTWDRMAGLLLIALLDVACFVSAFIVATGSI